MRYVLKDDGYAWRVIYSGRQKVGRVWRNQDGTFTGKIGADERNGVSFNDAFSNVAAVALGFNNLGELRRRQSEARFAKKAMRHVGDRVLNELMHGNFSTLDKIPVQHQPAVFTATIGALTRSMKSDRKRRA